MATQFMEFQYSDTIIDFSEAFDDKSVTVRMRDNKGNSSQLKLSEENIIALVGWLDDQLTKMKNKKNDNISKSVKKTT